MIRKHSRITPFGGVLDSTLDRFADAFILIGIIYGGFVDPIIGILALHASITVSYVRARAESEGIECNVGIAERPERLVILMAGAFLGYFIDPVIQLFMDVKVSLIFGRHGPPVYVQFLEKKSIGLNRDKIVF